MILSGSSYSRMTAIRSSGVALDLGPLFLAGVGLADGLVPELVNDVWVLPVLAGHRAEELTGIVLVIAVGVPVDEYVQTVFNGAVYHRAELGQGGGSIGAVVFPIAYSDRSTDEGNVPVVA